MTMTATPEVEVADLLAMLDGEPVCEVGDTTGSPLVPRGSCTRTARWIARLHCGHPVSVCHMHYVILVQHHGAHIRCGCGQPTVWRTDGRDTIGTVNGPMSVTGPRLIWYPL